MKKDSIYSMRVSTRILGALKRAAKKERRTVASLLDKIITDYLIEEGLLTEMDFGEERRRFPREKIPLTARTFLKAGEEVESFSSVIHDISMGGVMVSYPKGSDISFSSIGKLPDFELLFELPRGDERLRFDCSTCHMRDTGNEIQVGAAFISPNESDLQRLQNYIM